MANKNKPESWGFGEMILIGACLSAIAAVLNIILR